MDVENLPTLQAKDFGNLVDPTRPILSFSWSAEGPHRVPGHVHPRAQIIFQTKGVYWISTSSGTYVVPPNQAIWLPSFINHETFTNDSAAALMLFVDEAYTGQLPQECIVVSVSPLLRELLTRVVANGNDYSSDGQEARLVNVMLDELNVMKQAPFYLPASKDKRLSRLMEILIEDPADDRCFEDLASQTGASVRTLARLFHKETGITFGEWRKQLRLLEAIERLDQGQSVTKVALDSGYNSPSAFIAMFRRTLGMAPGHYFKKKEAIQ